MKALFPSVLAFLLLLSCETASLWIGGSRGFVLTMEIISCFGLLGIFWLMGLGINGGMSLLQWRLGDFLKKTKADQLALVLTLFYLLTLHVFALQALVLYFHPKFRQPLYLGLAAGLGSVFGFGLLFLIYLPLTKALSIVIHKSMALIEKGFTRLDPNGSRWILALFNPLTKSGFFVYLLGLSLSVLYAFQAQFDSLHNLDFRWIYLALLWLYTLAVARAYTAELSGLIDELEALFFNKVHRFKRFFFLFSPTFWYLLIVLLIGYGIWVSALIDDRIAIHLKRDSRIAGQILGIYQSISDQDGDGVSAYFGQKDCQPLLKNIHPLAVDQGGQDLNCNDNRFQANHSPLANLELAPLPIVSGAAENWNVILLTVDALRYDQAMQHMPKLKAFAEQNLSFKNAYSHAPATYWSLPALLTGKMPSHIEMAPDQTPQPQELLLTEMLSAQQYHTALFANVTIFFVRGLRQGMYVSDYKTSDYTIHGALPGAKHLREGMSQYIDDFMARKIQPKKDKFFLWGHFYDAHDPYFDVPLYPSADGSDLSKYQAILRWLDDEISIFIEDLKKKGLLDKSILLITSDHGEEFLEHQHRFHGKSLYEEMLRVPLIISIPQFQKKDHLAQVLALPIGQRSIVPTLLDLLKIDRSTLYKNPLLSKQSFYPLLQNPSLLQQPKDNQSLFLQQSVFFEALADQNYGENLVGVRNQEHKLIYHLNDGILEYYDLKHDPMERENLFERVKQEPKLKALYQQLMQYVDFQRHLIWSKKANHK